jgi:hypothetical protein
LAQAIKTARELVLLPYTQRTVTERPGGRRGDRERPLSDTPPPAPPPVSVEATDETDSLGDPGTELAEGAEVEDGAGAGAAAEAEAEAEAETSDEADASVGSGEA